MICWKITPLLFLVPPSCIIVPIRDLGNKFSFTMTNTSPILTFELPTVFSTSYTGIDLLSGPYPDNYDEMRSRTPFTNKNIFRNSSMFFTKSSITYYKRMANNNGMDIDKVMNNNSPTLSYKKEQEKTL